jgi:hypothetical protein
MYTHVSKCKNHKIKGGKKEVEIPRAELGRKKERVSWEEVG